jgi:TolB protein
MFAYVDAIYFTAEVTRLWVVSSSGGEPIPVTDDRTNVWNPTWSADGRELFFVSNRGGSMDLWQQRIGGDGKPKGEAVPITTGLGMRSAAFSPDGARLAYSRGRLVSNVWRVPILRDRLATWADALQLTFDNAFVEFIDVSPDGTLLAINSDRVGNQDLWILPSEGGEMTPLATDPRPDWAPRWSPDSEEIAFYSYRSGNREIWVMPAGGGPSRQLTSHPAEDAVPTWSPDGREIAFISRRSGNRDIWVVAAEGGEPRQVTVDPLDADFPVWSPDGRSLVYQSLNKGEIRLFVIPAEGGEPKLFSEGPGLMARWSPDGKVLYFTGGEERAANLWALSPEDGREFPVTDLAGRSGSLGYALATDGQYLYFTWWEDLGDLWVMDVAEQ